ncbi:M23 family metallopeptidase [Cryobacterium frigoriphilum]|uniref:M23 family metallopeptidase n=1 Tax=Cryobacterium frigoriphilum TaxID=1259150 RepID=A0A4R9ABJ4_9MICO|nr:M23 family metallopeptidase [Cryobacterium frigoriphilum]
MAGPVPGPVPVVPVSVPTPPANPPTTPPTATTMTPSEPQADPIPQTAQLPAEFALQSALVAAERAAASAAERAAAAERASAARTARIMTALTEYDAAIVEVDTATRAAADARADHETALSQSALVHRLADSAGRTATASQVSLAGLVRAMAQGEAGTATADALLDGGPDANLLYRLGALDRLGSLTENIHTVRARVVAERQRADDLAEQDAALVIALDPAPVAAAVAAVATATATADASRERLLALGAELSMSTAVFSSTGVTFASLLSAADAGLLSDQGWARPAVGRVTSGYGSRPDLPVAGVGAVHFGTDLGAACGAGVYAATSGIVAAVGEAGGYGNWILIDHGEGVATGYAHVATASTRVVVGERISAGQVIAEIGSTGASTGCHLHFEVRLGGIRVDAVPFLHSRGIRLAAPCSLVSTVARCGRVRDGENTQDRDFCAQRRHARRAGGVCGSGRVRNERLRRGHARRNTDRHLHARAVGVACAVTEHLLANGLHRGVEDRPERRVRRRPARVRPRISADGERHEPVLLEPAADQHERHGLHPDGLPAGAARELDHRDGNWRLGRP